MPLYDDVTVSIDLDGPDGNAFVVMGRVGKALKRAGHADVVEEFYEKCKSGNYQHLLEVCKEYVNFNS